MTAASPRVPTGTGPLATLRQVKYRPPVGRVDNVYGDRKLFCSCVPVSDYARGNAPRRAAGGPSGFML